MMVSFLFRWWIWLSEALMQSSAWASLHAAAVGPLPAVCQWVPVSAMLESGSHNMRAEPHAEVWVYPFPSVINKCKLMKCAFPRSP